MNPDCKFNGNIYCDICDGFIDGLNFLGQRKCHCDYLSGPMNRLNKFRGDKIEIIGDIGIRMSLIEPPLRMYIYFDESDRSVK